jgi:hypothetical protein
MDAIEFDGIVKDGKIPHEMSLAIRDVIRRFEGKRLKVTIAKYKRQRSRRQNAYYWGVIVEHVFDMFVEYGNDVTKEDVHQYLKEHIGKLFKEIEGPGGEIKTIIRSSTELSTIEWEDYCERCRAWSAELGRVIPLPNEMAVS